MPASRILLNAIALFCFSLICLALYLQHMVDMLPCPLCVMQRYAFLVTGLFCLLAASTMRVKTWAAAALVGALAGLATAAKHVHLLANPGMSCGIDPMETLLNKLPTAIYMPALFQADGLCEDASELLYGYSIPQWSLAAFIVIAVVLAYILVRKRH
ncbi:MAG: disulfide bond formation protein B [Pseudomonadota bacterium]